MAEPVSPQPAGTGADGADSPVIILVSGPSGVGKDSVIARVRKRATFAVPVTMTTRPPRPGEVEGRDYYFVSREQFLAHLEADELLEHAEVYGNLYGVPRSEWPRVLATGQDVIVRVDVQGCRTLRPLLPGAITVFMVPAPREASVDEQLRALEAFLRQRNERDEVIAQRLAAAPAELAAIAEFDHVVLNVFGGLDAAATDVLSIVEAERARRGRGTSAS